MAEATAKRTESALEAQEAPRGRSGGAVRGDARGKLPDESPGLDSRLVAITLESLDDNPYQHRLVTDPAKLEELAGSIESNGLLHPIAVRPVGERWQVIAGHRRRDAYALLLSRATADEERSRWRAIPCQVRLGVDDEQMQRLGLTENLQRDDPSALEAAAGLADYQNRQGLGTAELAERMNLDSTRVKRLLQLNSAPAVIKDGVTKGVSVPVLDEATGAPVLGENGKERHRHERLDLMAALEFLRLHAFWAKDNPKRADERISALIARALTESWGLRRIKTRCEALRASRTETESPAALPVQKRPLFREKDGDILISRKRLAGAPAEQRAELRAFLEQLLAAVAAA